MSKKVSMTARPSAVPPAADKWVGERTAKAAPAGPIKRLTIDLELAQHTRFKVLCAEKGLKMADEIRTLIERRIAELEGQGRRH
jgi:hypothetical protein